MFKGVELTQIVAGGVTSSKIPPGCFVKEGGLTFSPTPLGDQRVAPRSVRKSATASTACYHMHKGGWLFMNGGEGVRARGRVGF